MKLYIKQKVFSWGDKFRIYDAWENDRYYVEGEVFSLGKKLHLYDLNGIERSYIHQKVLSFLPRFFIGQDGTDHAEVVKKFTFFHPEYQVNGPDWSVTGDFLAHSYVIKEGNSVVASISKKWLTWGDTYEIDITTHADEVMVLSVVIVIDAILAQSAAASSSASTSSSH